MSTVVRGILLGADERIGTAEVRLATPAEAAALQPGGVVHLHGPGGVRAGGFYRYGADGSVQLWGYLQSFSVQTSAEAVTRLTLTAIAARRNASVFDPYTGAMGVNIPEWEG